MTVGARKKGRLTTLVFVALLAVGFVAVSYYDTYNYEHRVPLGTWYGTFSTPTAQRGALLLVLTARKTSTGTNGSYSTGGPLLFRGTARLCLAGGGGRSFVVDGRTDVNGPGFDTYLVPSPAPFDGLGFTDLRGIKQPNLLALSSTLGAFRRDGSYVTSSGPTLKFTVAKGDERRYRESCAAIGAEP